MEEIISTIKTAEQKIEIERLESEAILAREKEEVYQKIQDKKVQDAANVSALKSTLKEKHLAELAVVQTKNMASLTLDKEKLAKRFEKAKDPALRIMQKEVAKLYGHI